MVRASTTGMIDFRKFDPWDAWCWRNLRWVLNELEKQQIQDICRVQHNHWITIAAHGNLTEDSCSKAKANAGTAFNKLMKATFPWLADTIGEEGTKTDRDEAVAAYHDLFGRPGDPHYEAMVDELARAFAKPMTALDKARDRARRKAAQEKAKLTGG